MESRVLNSGLTGHSSLCYTCQWSMIVFFLLFGWLLGWLSGHLVGKVKFYIPRSASLCTDYVGCVSSVLVRVWCLISCYHNPDRPNKLTEGNIMVEVMCSCYDDTMVVPTQKVAILCQMLSWRTRNGPHFINI